MILDFTGKQITINDFSKKNIVTMLVKKHLFQNNISHKEVFEKLGFEKIQCAWCGELAPFYYLVEYDEKSGILKIVGVEYKKNALGEILYLCSKDNGANMKCSSNLLANTSIDFISKSRNITITEAKKIFRDRYGPFTLKEFIKKFGEKRGTQKWLEKVSKCGCSLEKMVRRYGLEEGKKKYNDWLEKVKLTLERYIKKYGVEQGEIKYKEAIENMKPSLKNFIKRLGPEVGRLEYLNRVICNGGIEIYSKEDFIQYATHLIKKNDLYLFKDFPIKTRLLKKNPIVLGLEIFNLTIEKLIESILKTDSEIMAYSGMKKPGSRGFTLWTEDGQSLLSSYEYKFYLKLKQHGLDKLFLTNRRYPNSRQKYDFYFTDFGIYIEIAEGLDDDPDYRLKMKKKNEKYGSWILTSDEEQNEAIEKLLELRRKKSLTS